MSAGTGYRYLMSTVAVSDGDRRMSTPLTRYYAEAGTPPGRWMGAGLAGLDGGRGLEAGSVVTEKQLFQLLGMAADPVTGAPLGGPPRRAEPGYRERVHARMSALPAGLSAAERSARLEQITSEEHARATSRAGKAVAGFDLVDPVGVGRPRHGLRAQVDRPAADAGQLPGALQEGLAGPQAGFGIEAFMSPGAFAPAQCVELSPGRPAPARRPAAKDLSSVATRPRGCSPPACPRSP